MARAAVSLDDKYTCGAGRVYLTGIQALVRLPMLQQARDAAAGLDTAGFISGYRGSPLGGYDQALARAKPFLDAHAITVQPGVNEELAATAVWGSQQVGLFPGARHDGVFGLWYGKGPGVDRSGDAFKHANMAGSARHGGVLVLAGDDHAAKSSTVPQQSEFNLMGAMIPVLNPAGVQELLDYGLIGWALSRFSGCWVALKVIAETADSAASVVIDPARGSVVLPEDFPQPPGGLNIRWPDPPLEQEERLLNHKMPAVLAFARANRLDRVVLGGSRPRLGIVTTGKAYLDVRQALDDLGISEPRAASLGLAVYKVGLTWPLEGEGIRRFAHGLEEILVVEEKRAVIESQLKEQLYNWDPGVRPRVVGKADQDHRPLLSAAGELAAAQVAVVIGRRLLALAPDPELAGRIAFLEAEERRKATRPAVLRRPYFCPGCPHNTSTVVPDGSRALGGIGCHYMAIWMDRQTETFSQMGGEGAAWIGQAPFTETRHVFANLGDGTYFHSGVLAIRAAVAAKSNITFKLLYNDAVAMTGGQRVDESLTVPRLTRQLAAEGVGRIVVVTDEPDRYGPGSGLAPYTTVEPREELDRVQRALRAVAGVSVLVYDQTCAAEKRRRRKRGQLADPPRRVVINERVCEGCGDCSAKSNCLAVVPVDTEFGRKRQIDQSACNKDFSCLNGFCPSFVTVEGGRLRRPTPPAAAVAAADALPEPVLPALTEPYNIYVTGVGGTGVVTIGALLGMAAHLEGKGCTSLDMTGLAQKGGAVTSHIRIAADQEEIHAVRIAAGGAHLVLGCDLVVAAQGDALSKMAPGRTRAVLNRHETVTGDFTRAPDFRVPVDTLLAAIARALEPADPGPGVALRVIDAGRLATALTGDALATNLFMLGYAWQQGLVPVSQAAILQAVALNGVAVDMNRAAFGWGRLAAADPSAVEQAAASATGGPPRPAAAATLDQVIARRAEFLTGYQDTAYAARYRALVERVRAVETSRLGSEASSLTEAVAHAYFKLLAYKDEYEVARLYADGHFHRHVADRFEGPVRLSVHLAPPFLARPDPVTGEPRKGRFGPWIMAVFALLARLKGVRGTRFDPFGYSAERRLERRLIADYEETVAELLAGLTPDNQAIALEIFRLPLEIRGFGPVKARGVEQAKRREADLLDRFRNCRNQTEGALAA